MYEAFFGLRSRPFNPLPRVDAYVALTPTRETLDGLVRCVEQDRGIGVLTSSAGTGKSLVCRLLQKHFADQRRTVLLTTGRFPTRRALLQAILFEMKHPYVGLSEQEARLRLLDLLQSSPAPLNRMLLIVDEAHLLSPKGHEELRTLTDYEVGGVPYVSLVLSGQLELEEALAEPGMNALNQRVGCHVSLEPLTIEESYEYIRERLRMAGNDGLTIFSPEALYLICNASEGNPRRLNQLCDHCMLLAYAEGTRPVDAAVVRSALLDLRELPLHWNSPLDLSETLAPNPLEAFAETHSAEAGEVAAMDDAVNIDEPHSEPSVDADSAPAAVYEVGGDDDGAAIDQLFQTSEFIVPSDLQDEGASFSQILREPLTGGSSLDLVTGAYETTPDPVIDDKDEVEIEAIPEPEFPSQSFESVDSQVHIDISPELFHSEIQQSEILRSSEPEEFVIDDTYAVIDRISESTSPRPIAAPVLPPITHSAISFATPAPVPTESDGSDEGTLPAEEQILDMVREMSAEVQQVRQEAAKANLPESDRPTTDSTPRYHSLRQALSWQFDVVEPESASHSEQPQEPASEAVTEQSASHDSNEAKPQLQSVDTPETEHERRYAQLFTRLQKQRRRVEAVMNRERRPSGEARIS